MKREIKREAQHESLIPTQSPLVSTTATFTHREWDVLQRLRHRYHDGQDLWDVRELAHLRFYRWLRATGRIES